MPGIDGFEVTQYVNDNFPASTVVVIVSALATVEAAVEVTRHGAFDFLVKPFTPKDLGAVADRAVEQRKLILDREKYLSQLNSEQNLSRQLINSLQEGLVVLNIRHKPVLMNPKAEYFLGKIFNEELTVQDLFKEPKIREAVETFLPSPPGQEAPAKVFQLKQEDRMLQIRVAPYVRDSEVGGAIVVISDFTEEWKNEQDKNRFVSMVAHELKSPLAAIINYINVIQTGMFDANAPKVHEILERCKIRGEALLELIRDLLYINKREAGKIEKSIEKLNLKEVIFSQLEFYKVQADVRKIALTMKSAQEGPCFVKADRADLDRVFMNLISNGIKYNRDNGALIVDIGREDGFVKVSLEDSGIGMGPAEIKNLFQEFYRVRNSTTSGISGTGLGLATVKRVLGEYNGRISVQSEPDKGSTFTVYLPAVDG
jgi:two-component system phosphate regulon sensor histidine kinase PhoR